MAPTAALGGGNGEEQAVLVGVPLHGENYGSIKEREAILALADQLADSVSRDRTGEFDGEEFGRENCTLYFYGPDADNLFSAWSRISAHFVPASRPSSVMARRGNQG